jgi:hypothetical protein
MGGIVLFCKNEADEWVRLCERLGRGHDVIRVEPGGRHKFNFLDWLASWGDPKQRGPIATVAFLEEVASAIQSGGGGTANDNAFFQNSFRNRLTNLVHLCQLAGLPVSLPLMRAIANASPQTIAQSKDLDWRRESVCWHMLREAEAATAGDPAGRADFEECRRHFIEDYPSLSFRTRGVVDTIFTSLVRAFLTRPLRPLFCEETNVTPEMCFEGKLILIAIPVSEYGLTARVAALTWKKAFQIAVMRRSGPPGTLRPAFWYCDEAQAFLSPGDNEYQAVARGSGGVTFLLTQQFSSIREALGSNDKAENLTANLQTKWFCQNTGETNEWASKLIGERYTPITALNVGRGGAVQAGIMGDASTHAGINRSDQKRAFIEPSAFQKLRRGGVANNRVVEAVVFCGGKMFAGEKEPQPFKILAFPQPS